MSESYMNLGEAGDVVDVSTGYARNFLIPQKIAVTATKANIKRFEDKAKELDAKKTSERENSKKTLGQLESLKLIVKKKTSEEGKLFGAVTTKDIEEEFSRQGVSIDRRQIVLGQQIKMAGEYKVLVKLVGGMKSYVAVNVISDAPTKVTA